jgi:hypothetical protein
MHASDGSSNENPCNLPIFEICINVFNGMPFSNTPHFCSLLRMKNEMRTHTLIIVLIPYTVALRIIEGNTNGTLCLGV